MLGWAVALGAGREVTHHPFVYLITDSRFAFCIAFNVVATSEALAATVGITKEIVTVLQREPPNICTRITRIALRLGVDAVGVGACRR